MNICGTDEHGLEIRMMRAFDEDGMFPVGWIGTVYRGHTRIYQTETRTNSYAQAAHLANAALMAELMRAATK